MSENKEKKNSGQKRDEAVFSVVRALEAWVDQYGESYISIPSPPAKHSIHVPLGTAQATAWITTMLLKRNIRTGHRRLAEEVSHLLTAKTYTEGEKHQVYNRIAGDSNAIYINLMDDTGRAIKVDPLGVEVIKSPPYRFTMPKDGLPLPEPDLSGTLDDLKELVTTERESDFCALVSWELNAMFPFGPFPILALNGEQGSGKSTMTRLFRWLIDPRMPMIETLQTNDRNLMVTADQAHILCYDNLSRLTQSQSDAFCRLSTGGGYKTRKNYADKEPVLFDAMRPVIFNGIENVAAQFDLLSRCLIITLPPIPPIKRLDEESFWKRAEELRPKILGAMCKLLSAALKNMPETEVVMCHRMADFIKRVSSVETLIGWDGGGFSEYYLALANETTSEAIEGDSVIGPILRLMDGKKEWIGNSGKLRQEIFNKTPYLERKFIPKKLPLKRIKPGLKAFGIELIQERNSQQRLIVLRNQNPGYKVVIDPISDRDELLGKKVEKPDNDDSDK